MVKYCICKKYYSTYKKILSLDDPDGYNLFISFHKYHKYKCEEFGIIWTDMYVYTNLESIKFSHSEFKDIFYTEEEYKQVLRKLKLEKINKMI